MTANAEKQEREGGQASHPATGGVGIKVGAVSRRRLLRLAAYSVPAMSLLNVAGVARAAHMSGHVCVDDYCLTATTTPGYNKVDLSWNAVPGAGYYKIYRRVSSSSTWTYLGWTSGTTYTSSGLTNGVEYCFYVQAVIGGVPQAGSAEACATPTLGVPVLTAATTPGYNQVDLSWGAIPGAGHYKVYRRVSTSSTWTYLGWTSGTTYTSTGLTNGVEYCFAVTAVNGGGETAKSAEACATPTLGVPVLSAATTPGVNAVDLSWGAVTGAGHYKVYRRLSSGSTWTYLGWTSGTTYTSTGLTNGVEYCFAVTAVNGGGETAKSAEACATPTLDVPSGLTATPGSRKVDLSWGAVTGAGHYKVYRRLSSGSTWTYLGWTSGTTYTSSGLTGGTGYCFAVTAVNGGGETAKSAEACATPWA